MAASRFSKQSLWLCCPPAALCILDGVLTLFGQPVEYWQADYANVSEMSPSFNALLQIHPIAFLLGTLTWLVIISLLILLLPSTWALIFSVAATMGHTVGAATWILWRFDHGYNALIALVFLTSALVVFTLRKGQRESGQAAIDWSRTGLPPWSRWIAIAFLLALAVALFVRP